MSTWWPGRLEEKSVFLCFREYSGTEYSVVRDGTWPPLLRMARAAQPQWAPQWVPVGPQRAVVTLRKNTRKNIIFSFCKHLSDGGYESL